MTARALEGERALVRELQQLDDYRSQLIATLSHELRTPLTVISGNLEMLGELDLEDAERYHQAMTRGTERMRKVVDDLLLLARVSDPQHPITRGPVDLHEVVLEVTDDGIGISEEDQAIVATIVERHRGRVDVRSRLGEGTTFTVSLPAATTLPA